MSLQRCGSLLWLTFTPWHRNFHVPWGVTKKKKKTFWLSAKRKDREGLVGKNPGTLGDLWTLV